jgi:hypothetical protein
MAGSDCVVIVLIKSYNHRHGSGKKRMRRIVSAEKGDSAAMEWYVEGAHFYGAGESLRWNARIRIRGHEKDFPALQLMIFYGSEVTESSAAGDGEQEVASCNIDLSGSERATLMLCSSTRACAAAVENPSLQTVFSFLLAHRGRLFLSQEHCVETSQPAPFKELLGLLPQVVRKLAYGMIEQNEEMLEGSPLVRLARSIICSRDPLGPTDERIIIASCRLLIGESSSTLRIEEDRFQGNVVRIAARRGERISLFPEFRVIQSIPFVNHVDRSCKPLPPYGFVKLEDYKRRCESYGEPTDREGIFQIGPVLLDDLRGRSLTAIYPLFPPGREPAVDVKVLVRSGRPTEAYVDNRKRPPLPPLPKDFEMEDTVAAVVKELSFLVHPDTGEIGGLDSESLLDLLCFAERELTKYPELYEAVQRTVRDSPRMSPASLGAEVTAAPGRADGDPTVDPWSEELAKRALGDRRAAEELAQRMKHHFHPRVEDETVFSKPEPGAIEPVDSTHAEDRVSEGALAQSGCAHALAIAALSGSDAARYIELIRAHLQYLLQIRDSVLCYPLERLITTGQALKSLLSHLVEEAELKSVTALLLGAIREAAFRRFVREYRELHVKKKIDIAHLISPLWRPYLSTEEAPSGSTRNVKGHRDRPPEQRIALSPGGTDLSAEVLEEARRRYRSALRRAVAAAIESGKPVSEERRFVESVHQRWCEYLFDVHKGGYLQPYEEKLERDFSLALEAVENKRDL